MNDLIINNLGILPHHNSDRQSVEIAIAKVGYSHLPRYISLRLGSRASRILSPRVPCYYAKTYNLLTLVLEIEFVTKKVTTYFERKTYFFVLNNENKKKSNALI